MFLALVFSSCSAVFHPNSMSRVLSACSASPNYKARPQGLLHPMRVASAPEGQHEVIGVAHQPHPARRMPTTLSHPQVQGVVQEDVHKQRADARALGGRPLVRVCVDSTLLHDARPEPLSHQPQAPEGAGSFAKRSGVRRA